MIYHDLEITTEGKVSMILTPSEAAGRTGDGFVTAFFWRKNPVLERIQQVIAENCCGELCSLRFTWSRPKRFATGEREFLYDTFAAMLDGAQQLAGAEFRSLYVEKVPGMNNLFALVRFGNEVVAECELNECLPETMPDICFVKANFSNGHVTNQPLVGYFNEEGMVFATDEILEFPVAELAALPPANGPVEQMKQRFTEAARLGLVPPGPGNAAAIQTMIREALR